MPQRALQIKLCICSVLLLAFTSCADDPALIEKFNFNSIPSSIEIKPSTKKLQFDRGQYTLILRKQGVFDNQEYTVTGVDLLQFTGDHQPSPEDVYARTFRVKPKNGSQEFDIGILPSNQDIRETSGRIKIGDTIKVTGTRFKHVELFQDGKAKNLGHCLSAFEVYYLKSLGRS